MYTSAWPGFALTKIRPYVRPYGRLEVLSVVRRCVRLMIRLPVACLVGAPLASCGRARSARVFWRPYKRSPSAGGQQRVASIGVGRSLD